MLNPRVDDAAVDARFRFFSGLHASDRCFVAVKQFWFIKFEILNPQSLHCFKITPLINEVLKKNLLGSFVILRA